MKKNIFIVILVIIIFHSNYQKIITFFSPSSPIKTISELIKASQYEAALNLTESSLLDEPNNHKLWFKKGLILSKLNKPDDAFNCYLKTTQLNPNYADSWYNMSLIQKNKGNLSDSLDYCNKFLSINTTDTQAINLKNSIVELKNYITDLKSTIDSFQEIYSVVKVGVNRITYHAKLQNCQIKADKFINDHPNEIFEGVNDIIYSTIYVLADAEKLWERSTGTKIYASSTSDYKEKYKFLFDNITFYPKKVQESDLSYYLTNEVLTVFWNYAEIKTKLILQLIDKYK